MPTREINADLSVLGKVTAGAGPTASGDLVRKVDLDAASALAGSKTVLVRAAATANVTIASAIANGSTLDGVTLATNDWVLLPLQTTTAENGIYVVQASGAAVRHPDFDASGDLTAGTDVRVKQGTANVGSTWRCSNVSATPWIPGTSTSTWVKILGPTGAAYQVGGTDVSVADGGTGRSTATTAYGLIAAGTTATGAQQTIAPVSQTTYALFSTGTTSLPAFRAITVADFTGTIAQLNTAITDADIATLAGTETLSGKTLAGPAFTGTPTGLTKAHVGLGSVDNTSDVGKPISTATQTALDAKADAAATTTALAGKASTGSVAAKADTTYVDALLGPASGVELYLTAPLSVPDQVLTVVPWTGERSDPGGFHAPNATDIILPAGDWEVVVQVSWGEADGDDLNTTGNRFHHLEMEETGDVARIVAAVALKPTSSFGDCTGVMTWRHRSTVSVRYRVVLYQDSLGARAFGGANRLPATDGISASTEFTARLCNVGPKGDPGTPGVPGLNGLAGVWKGTAAEYAAITTKDPNTLYFTTA